MPRRYHVLALAGLLATFFAGLGPVASAQVIYIDGDATGAGTGSNWTDAYTDLQDALAWATSGWEVWVAEGLYTPTDGSDRSISFVLANGVELYGGFNGTETSRDERDWTMNESILSGDIGIKNESGDNSYHVVTGNSVDSTAILDGFTVTEGKADSQSTPNDRGAGILAMSGSPTVRNTLFVENIAAGGGVQRGGGGYLEASSAVFENCVFESNGAFGGGLYIEGGAPTIRFSNFVSNVTGSIFFAGGTSALIEDSHIQESVGSGAHLESSSPTFRRVTFKDNTNCAACDGGAIRIEGSSAPLFEDCLFEDNMTMFGGGGGAVYIDETASPAFIRTTFRNNTSSSAGGAISARQIDGFTLIMDCVFERNTALNAGALLLFDSHGAIINSVFRGNRTTSSNGGGAIYVSSSSSSGPGVVLANNLFVGNRGHLGGGVRITGTGTADVQIVNTTIAYNEALVQGGGVYSRDFDGPQTEARFENVIIWGNTAPEGPNIYWEEFDSGPPEVTRSIVDGGYPLGTDILDADPLFVRNPNPGPDGNWGTDDDDYGDLRLRTGSPGVDYGLQAFLPADIWDLDGDGNTTEPLPIDLNDNPRVQMAEVDLGAYEGAVIVSNEQEVPEPETALRVYPNPANDYLTIETDSEQIEVVDVLGRVVLRSSGGHVDVSALPNGVYLVRAGGQTARVTIRR